MSAAYNCIKSKTKRWYCAHYSKYSSVTEGWKGTTFLLSHCLPISFPPTHYQYSKVNVNSYILYFGKGPCFVYIKKLVLFSWNFRNDEFWMHFHVKLYLAEAVILFFLFKSQKWKCRKGPPNGHSCKNLAGVLCQREPTRMHYLPIAAMLNIGTVQKQ